MDSTAATSTDPAGRSFADVWSGLDAVSGWLTRAQAARLWDAASRLGAGDQIVEIGSFHGRSAIVLASAAPAGVRITTIDPHAGNDRGPEEIEGFANEAERDHRIFLANLAAAGVSGRITHLREFSGAAHPGVDGGVELLYIDGAHRFAPARSDIVSWGNRVTAGGTLLIHDAFSSIGVTLALMTTTFAGGRFRYVGRSGSMVEYRREHLGLAGRAANLARQAAQLPWFVRNVAVKVLITLRAGRVARLLGSDGTWPY